jgi:hypothetical protein
MVGIPRGAEHREGAVMVYRYRMYTTGGDLLRSADCEVPRTRTAFVHLSQELEVPTATWSTVLARFDVGPDDEISGQGCVNGFCEIEGICQRRLKISHIRRVKVAHPGWGDEPSGGRELPSLAV